MNADELRERLAKVIGEHVHVASESAAALDAVMDALQDGTREGEELALAWVRRHVVPLEDEMETFFVRLVARDDGLRPANTFEVEASVDVDEENRPIGINWMRHL